MYTTARELDTKFAHAHEFYSVDYAIAYKDQLELVARLADSLEYEFKHDGNQRPSDMIPQIIDEWLTTWTGDLAQMWVDANCPQPDIHPDYTTRGELPIVQQMISALSELGHEFMSALLDETDELLPTLVRINAIWPVTTK